jgi:hypothetical protein
MDLEAKALQKKSKGTPIEGLCGMALLKHCRRIKELAFSVFGG